MSSDEWFDEIGSTYAANAAELEAGRRAFLDSQEQILSLLLQDARAAAKLHGVPVTLPAVKGTMKRSLDRWSSGSVRVSGSQDPEAGYIGFGFGMGDYFGDGDARMPYGLRTYLWLRMSEGQKEEIEAGNFKRLPREARPVQPLRYGDGGSFFVFAELRPGAEVGGFSMEAARREVQRLFQIFPQVEAALSGLLGAKA